MYNDILIPTDGSRHSITAAHHGRALTRVFGSNIHILSVVDTRAYSDHLADIDTAVRQQRSVLEDQANQAVSVIEDFVKEVDDVRYSTAIRYGSPHEAIRSYASENDIDLITMGTVGRTGVDRFLLGSVAERMVRASPVPVLTTNQDPPGEPVEYDTVLIPTDGSSAAEVVSDHGLSIADHLDASIKVLAVIGTGEGLPSPSDPSRKEAEDAVDAIAQKATQRGLEASTYVQTGTPYRRIREFIGAHGVDLVAMGKHSRAAIKRHLIGSVTEKIIRTSEVPVISMTASSPDREPMIG